MKKKYLALLLVLALIFSLFSGCASEPGKIGEQGHSSESKRQHKSKQLRVLVDAAIDYDFNSLAFSDVVPIEEVTELFLDRLADAGGPTDIVVEYLPHAGSVRETMIDRLRIEIGTGEGPDIFIMACDSKSSMSHKSEALFLMPEKAMELGTFLPLDEYIENETKYAEWDQMNQVVLAAGKNKEGQQIIPLAYTFPIVTFRQSEATHIPDKSLTWDDMLTSDDINLRAAAVWTDNTSENYENCPFVSSREGLPEYILGDIADFSSEKLLFTEKELRECMKDIFRLGKCFTDGEFSDAAPHYNEFIGLEYNRSREFVETKTFKRLKSHSGIADNTNATIIPLYSDDGGVTATITAYAAINRNTLHAAEAYEVIDFFLSTPVQQSGGIYRYFYSDYTHSTQSVPMNNNLMNGYERCIYEWKSFNKAHPDTFCAWWYMKRTNFEAYAAVRDQITRARFRNTLDIEFDRLYWDYHEAETIGSGEQDEIVAKAYETMKRMMKE